MLISSYSGVGRCFLIGGLETEAVKWLIVILHGARKFLGDLFFNHKNKQLS